MKCINKVLFEEMCLLGIFDDDGDSIYLNHAVCI